MNLDVIDAEYERLRSDLVNYVLGGGRLAVVKAPPGSGKTFTLIEVLTQLVASGRRIAVGAQTNSQADDICLRFGRDHPEIPVARFSSKGLVRPKDFPEGVLWVTDKEELPSGPGVTVGTTAKWSLTLLDEPYDLLAIDEAWQMSWADLMQCAVVSERFLMIGDPGQIPPVVTVDVRRWETSPRAPHEPAPEVVLAEDTLKEVCFVGSLPACRRLPNESVAFVRPFYDFEFAPYVEAGTRGVDFLPEHPWASVLGQGRPLVLTVPTPAHGPPVEVDHEVAAAVNAVVLGLLTEGVTLRAGDGVESLSAAQIGVTSSHRVMNSAIGAALGALANDIRVDTPERWQGLERPIMIAVHPLSGVVAPSAFDLETGRLCVMASRHQAGLVVLTRDHVGETLRNFIPSAEQAPGRPDVVGRGHDAHMRFWEQLEAAGSVVALT